VILGARVVKRDKYLTKSFGECDVQHYTRCRGVAEQTMPSFIMLI
jgi:hypothetical protein